MLSKKFELADRVFFHDRIMHRTVLKLFPRKVTPNMVTIFRFVTTPIVAFLMLTNHYLVGLLTFLAVAFTDMIDGSLARNRNQVTEWGKVCDPLADKILISAMIFIIALRYIGPWTAGIIVGLEFIIVASAWREKMEGKEIRSNIWGKAKMLFQVLGVAILLVAIIFDVATLLPLASSTLYLAIAFALVSLLSHAI